MISVSREGNAQGTLHTLRIDGRDATQREAKRILPAPALPAQNDLASKPLHSVARSFSILRKDV